MTVMGGLFRRGAMIAALTSLAAWGAAQTLIQQARLFEIAAAAERRDRAAYDQAVLLAGQLGLPLRTALPGGGVMEIQSFQNGVPVYTTTTSLLAADTIGADELWTGGNLGLNLNGAGAGLGIWDGGTARSTHREFAGRLTRIDGEAIGDHATHVAGTMVSAGIMGSARGMSNGATIRAWGWNSDTTEMAGAASTLRVSNHSYGTVAGWQFSSGAWYWYGDIAVNASEDWKFGYYDSKARDWDDLARNAPNYLIVKAAGNDRGSGPSDLASGFVWSGSAWIPNTQTRQRDGGGTGYDTLPTYSTAKNILTVGAVNPIPGGYAGAGTVVMSTFSGWGPTDDGRIKPDVVGCGVNVTGPLSTADDAYGTMSGTSMASPNVAGALGLLQQHFRNTFDTWMTSASLKALAIHTADEAGVNAGPDYAHGWGLFNARSAAQAITRDTTITTTIMDQTLTNGQSWSAEVPVSGSEPLKVTIVWMDAAGTPGSPTLDATTPMLVNDLDLRVVQGTTTTLPWILDPSSPANGATRGDNVRDNVEQVLVASPTAGTATITVSHKGSLSGGSQAFAVIVTGQLAEDANLPTVQSVVLDPASVAGGQTSTGTVTLSDVAPAGGLTVNLASANSSVVTVPSTITVAGGASTATFTATARPVRTDTPVVLTASLGSSSQTATLNVTAPPVDSISVSPAELRGGQVTRVTVVLAGPAPTGGVSVRLTSSHPTVAPLPSSVTVLVGQTSLSFNVTTRGVAAVTAVTFTAVSGGESREATLTVNPPDLVSVVMASGTGRAGTPVRGTITLNGPAPSGGLAVGLALDPSSAGTLPSSVTVPAGALSATFNLNPASVTAEVDATVTASLRSDTDAAAITILPVGVSTVVLSPVSVIGPVVSRGTVTLNGPAPTAGLTVTLTSSDTDVATVPATVTVLGGARTATFVANTSVVPTNTTVTVTGSGGGLEATGRLTVTPHLVTSVVLSPASVIGGARTRATVTLNAPAPTGGATVTLASSDTDVADLAASVTIPAGRSSAVVDVQSSFVSARTPAVITATYNGVQRRATLTVNPLAIAAFTASPTILIGGTAAVRGTLILNAPAPAGGAEVTLTSSAGAVDAPTTVTVPAGATSLSFFMPTTYVSAVTRTTVTAAYNNSSRLATVTVNPITVRSLTASPATLRSAGITSVRITLTVPAPAGGLTVALSSSDTNVLDFGVSTVIIPAGAIGAILEVQVGTVNATTRVTARASLHGFSVPVTVTVTP